MTVAAAGPLVFTYAGNGSTTNFAVPIRFLEAGDLDVVLIASDGVEAVQSLSTHYTVSGSGSLSGGSITMLAAPASGASIRIRRVTEAKQIVDLGDKTENPADAVETQLDRLAMVAQDHARELERSVAVPYGDDQIVIHGGTAGQVAAFRSDGGIEGRNPSTLSPTTILTTSFMESALSGWGSQSAARTGLGAGATGASVFTAVTTAAALLAIGALAAFPSAFDTRTDAVAATIAAPVQQVILAGYATKGDGGAARYLRVASQPSHSGNFQSADGAWWEIVAESGRLGSKQMGAKGDDSTNDTTTLQNWLDTANSLNATAYLQPGTYRTTSLTVNGNRQKIVGERGKSILKFNAYTAAAIITATSKTAPYVEGIRFETIAYSTSTTSVTIGTGSQSFTIGTGLGYTASDILMLCANNATGDGKNYMIGSVTSYDGVTGALVINVTTAVGTGTFTSWVVVRNDGSGAAVRFTGCTDGVITECETGNYFYVGFETRNGNGDAITWNTVTNAINRPIYIYATSGTSDDIWAFGNVINGGGITQYGINLNGSTGGALKNSGINDNRIENVCFQAIEVGGATTDIAVYGNHVDNVYSTGGVAILIQRANGSQPQRTIVTGNVVRAATGYGIRDIDTISTRITDNFVTSCGIGISKDQVNVSCLGGGVNNNTVLTCTGDGIVFTAVGAALCGQCPATGNNVQACGGTGLKSVANCARIIFVANYSLGNTTANKSLLGTNITDNSNQTT